MDRGGKVQQRPIGVDRRLPDEIGTQTGDRIRLEEVLHDESNCPAAVVVDGDRAAPPEDCGHLVDAESLAEVLPDPAQAEPERVNKGFSDSHFVPHEEGIDVRVKR